MLLRAFKRDVQLDLSLEIVKAIAKYQTYACRTIDKQILLFVWDHCHVGKSLV